MKISNRQATIVQNPKIQSLFEGYYYMWLADISGAVGIIDSGSNDKAEKEGKAPPQSLKTSHTNSVTK